MHEVARIIWNSNAGSSSVQESVASRLSEMAGVRVIETAGRDEAIRTTRQAIRDSVPRIIAAGGDGTVNAVATAFMQEGAGESAFGVIPLGTGNDLARSLGMPLNPLDSLVQALEGRIHLIDVVAAEQPGHPRWIFNMVTAGNSGRFADRVTSELKEKWGVLAYLRAGVEALQDLTVYDVTLQADGAAPMTVRALNVFIANGRTSGGGLRVAPAACLTDGLLDYIVVLEGTGGALTTLAADYAFDRLLENELILAGRARSLRVTACPALEFSGDGDVIDSAPTSFAVCDGALPAVTGPGAAIDFPKHRQDSGSIIPPVSLTGVI